MRPAAACGPEHRRPQQTSRDELSSNNGGDPGGPDQATEPRRYPPKAAGSCSGAQPLVWGARGCGGQLQSCRLGVRQGRYRRPCRILMPSRSRRGTSPAWENLRCDAGSETADEPQGWRRVHPRRAHETARRDARRGAARLHATHVPLGGGGLAVDRPPASIGRPELESPLSGHGRRPRSCTSGAPPRTCAPSSARSAGARGRPVFPSRRPDARVRRCVRGDARGPPAISVRGGSRKAGRLTMVFSPLIAVPAALLLYVAAACVAITAVRLARWIAAAAAGWRLRRSCDEREKVDLVRIAHYAQVPLAWLILPSSPRGTP
jgi:hypothetical protein